MRRSRCSGFQATAIGLAAATREGGGRDAETLAEIFDVEAEQLAQGGELAQRQALFYAGDGVRSAVEDGSFLENVGSLFGQIVFQTISRDVSCARSRGDLGSFSEGGVEGLEHSGDRFVGLVAHVGDAEGFAL